MGAERIDPPAAVVTVADAIAWLRTRSPAHDATLADPGRLRAALDQRFVTLDTPIGQARELALFPPVTGG